METTQELQYALNTLWFVLAGALVMWMAAGFTMLEAGLVRTRHTTEILAKNVALYSIACIMYLLMGYNLMYGEGNSFIGSGWLLAGIAGEGFPSTATTGQRTRCTRISSSRWCSSQPQCPSSPVRSPNA